MKATLYINGTIAQGEDYYGGETFGLKNLVEFLSANPKATELDVYINSGGGSVNEGFAIYDRLMAFNGVVNTIVNGMCGSIATVIFLCPFGFTDNWLALAVTPYIYPFCISFTICKNSLKCRTKRKRRNNIELPSLTIRSVDL